MKLKKIKILIADDHQMFREAITTRLKANARFVVLGEASNGTEVIEKAKIMLPDIILMDIGMPEMDGLRASQILNKELPKVKILLLSMYEDPKYILQCLVHGARGYVLKDAPLKELYKAIDLIADGQIYFSPKISEVLLNDYSMMVQKEKTKGIENLTEREKEVLIAVAKGFSSKEIARFLNLKERTIMKYRENIMSKLNLHSAVDLTRFAIENKLI